MSMIVKNGVRHLYVVMKLFVLSLEQDAPDWFASGSQVCQIVALVQRMSWKMLSWKNGDNVETIGIYWLL